MKILLIGGTGFIGRELLRALVKERHNVIVLSRKAHITFGMENVFVDTVWWDGKKIDTKKTNYDDLDAIINLSGESIAAKRWSKKQKQKIISSRVEPINAMIELLKNLNKLPRFIFSASAVGFYGNLDAQQVDESFGKGEGFLSDVCKIWEDTARKIEILGVSPTIGRIGVVLGESGGALKKIAPMFKYNIGAILGKGTQGFSWIHIDDLVSSIMFLLSRNLTGVYNLTAPNPVSNKDFSLSLASVFRKRCRFKVPEFMLKIMLGEMSSTLIEGQYANPSKLIKEGFSFRYEKILHALHSIYR